MEGAAGILAPLRPAPRQTRISISQPASQPASQPSNELSPPNSTPPLYSMHHSSVQPSLHRSELPTSHPRLDGASCIIYEKLAAAVARFTTHPAAEPDRETAPLQPSRGADLVWRRRRPHLLRSTPLESRVPYIYPRRLPCLKSA